MNQEIETALLEAIWIMRWNKDNTAMEAVLTDEEAFDMFSSIEEELNKAGFRIVKDKDLSHPKEFVDFGNFIRENYYGVGAPKLISNFPSKYPHGTVEEIFLIWSSNNV